MDREKRKSVIKNIIEGLENHEPFKLLVEDKKQTVNFADSNWHLINLEDKDKLLELKYAKIAAENIVNTIDLYKQELESMNNQEQQETGYYSDD